MEGLTARQREVLEGLMARGTTRPVFRLELAAELRDALEAALEPVVAGLGVGEVFVNKKKLAQVLGCEAHHVAVEREGFAGWTPRAARGSVAHKAIELAVHLPPGTPPLVLADAAVDRLVADGGAWGPGRWLATADPVELAELRAEVNDVVVKFEECWPPLKPSWRPRTESASRVELLDGRVVLSGKIDLALGAHEPSGRAGVLVVDLKTGPPRQHHLDDLRFYALVHTIRAGVPPFRIASYYLDSATWRHEDVDETLLTDVALPRLVDGVTRLVELHLQARPPQRRPGPACGWCPDRGSCAEAAPPAGLDEPF